MTFTEAVIAIRDGGMARRPRWPDGVVFTISSIDRGIYFYHVAACSVGLPPDEDLLADDYIVVEDYGKDIGYKPW